MAAGPLTILVVEDEAFVAMDAAATLEEAGHEVCGIALAEGRGSPDGRKPPGLTLLG